MEITNLDLMTEITTYKRLHPRAYARSRNAAPNGLSKRDEWLIVDPDQGYSVTGIGDTELAAWSEAFDNDPTPEFI